MPSVQGRFTTATGTRDEARSEPAARQWVIRRDSTIAHRDAVLHLQAYTPFGEATLARSGARTLLLLGASTMADAGDLAMLCDALAGDSAAALRRVRGPFVLLYADAIRGILVFATDRAAIRSPCYAFDDGEVVFGLSAQDVARARRRSSQVRAQGIYEYVYFHVIPAPGTIYEEVRRLLPGEALRIGQEGATVEQYWMPSYAAATAPPAFAHAKSEFRELLRDAIATRLDRGPIGTFLSGGTDSSTVAGMLGVVSGRPAETYSIGFDVAGFDELAYARIASKHFGAHHHEYYLTPDDLLATIPAIASSFDQPFGNSSAIAAHFCARLAASDGIRRLLAGDGGDELFGGNTRYARQKVFEAYSHVPAWLRRGIAEPLLATRASSLIPLLRKAGSYVEQARVPMPARMQTYNLVDRIGRTRIFEPAFLHAIDPDEPGRLQADHYARCDDSAIVNRMLHFDWKFTLADNDLPKVVGACDLAGVDVAFPLLDERIVEFANRLPADWKVRHLELRPFFKTALADFLPHEVIRKRKHGFGLPFGHWLVAHEGLQRVATGSLESLRDRGVVQPAFFAELLDRVTTQHAGFYGELVWILMMLEQWLAAHEPGYRFAAVGALQMANSPSRSAV